jgi:ketosteroid isomerase-like protein
LRRELTMMKDMLPNGVALTVHTITGEDDRVHLELSGTAQTSNGKDYNNRYHWFIQVRDEKISVFRDYFDSDYAIRQLL